MYIDLHAATKALNSLRSAVILLCAFVLRCHVQVLQMTCVAVDNTDADMPSISRIVMRIGSPCSRGVQRVV